MKKKIKEKKFRNDRWEGDEDSDAKTKDKWFWKLKEDETKMDKEVGENNDRKNDKRFWKWFLK